MKNDLGVMISMTEEIDSFCEVAHRLGFSGIATPSQIGVPVKSLDQNMKIYQRTDIQARSIGSIRKQIDKVREHSVIVSLRIGTIETTNWAVEDKRVDLLTVSPTGEQHLRATTARMASTAETALEIQIAPLLQTSGLNRSKILKTYREASTTAIENEMMIVLTSGASVPMGLRSPIAISHIGMLLGMNKTYAENAISKFPAFIIQKNLKKLSSGYVSEGVEVLQRGDKS